METLYDKHKSKLNNWTFLVRNPALPTEILEEIIISPQMGNEEWNPNDTAWQNIMAHPSFTMKLIDKYMDDGIYDGEKYFKYLSMNPNLSPAFIDKYKTQLDWKWLSQNPALTTDLMEKHISRLKLDTLLDNPNLTFDFIYKNKLDRKIDWEGFAWHPNFSIDNFKFVMSHGDLYDLDRGEMWSHFSINPNITAEFIEDKCFMHPKDETCTHSFHLDWDVLSLSDLSPEFIRKNIGDFIKDYEKEGKRFPINYAQTRMNQESFDWEAILKNPSTPSDLLDEIADSVKRYENDRIDVRIKGFWEYVSQNPNLTPEFIDKYKYRWELKDWTRMAQNKNLSPQFWDERWGSPDLVLSYNRLMENPVIFRRISKYNPYERMVRKRMGLTYEAEAPSYCNRCYDGDLTPMTVYDDYDDKEYIYYSCNRCNYVSEPTVVEDERLKGNTCYMCDKDALFIYEDLPTGAKPFCSEKCMCQYGGMPYYGEGHYGLGIEGTEDAQTKMLLKRRGILKAENNMWNTEKQKVFVRQLLDGEPNYFGDLAWRGEYKGFKFEISKPSPAKEREQKKLYDWYKGEGYKIWLMLDDTLISNVEMMLEDLPYEDRGFKRYSIDIRYLGKDKYGKIKTMPQVKKIIRNFVDSMLDGTLTCGHEGCDKSLSAKDFYWCIGCMQEGSGDMFYCNEHYYTYSKDAKNEKEPSIRSGCKNHLKYYYEGKDFDEEKHLKRFLNPNVIRIKRMQEKRQFGNEEIRPQSRTIEYVGLGAVSVLLILALFKRR